MIEPFYAPVPNLHLKTPSPDAYLPHPESVQHHSEAPPSSGFQPVANMVSEAQTHASFTSPIDVTPPGVSRKTGFVPIALEPITIPSYYSSPMTVARWYEVPGFNQEFSLHNPEWKMLQGIPWLLCLKTWNEFYSAS